MHQEIKRKNQHKISNTIHPLDNLNNQPLEIKLFSTKMNNIKNTKATPTSSIIIQKNNPSFVRQGNEAHAVSNNFFKSSNLRPGDGFKKSPIQQNPNKDKNSISHPLNLLNLSQSSFFSQKNALQQSHRGRSPSLRTDNKEDNTSTISKGIKDRIKDFGNPLRGPVLLQMGVHYTYFLFVLLIASKSGWAPNIRFYMGFAYFNVSVFKLEISRMIFAKKPNSTLPIYLSIPLFALMILISREAHQIVMVLWYISFLLVALQFGSNSLKKHFIAYTIVFMSTYYISTWLMTIVFVQNCDGQFFCGSPLKPPISLAFEATLVLACFTAVVSCMKLETFIRKNALALLEREKCMRQLYFLNIDLKRQLRQDNKTKEIDMEAPLTRATMILKQVKDSGEVDENVQRELEIIIGLLSSDQLFSPDIQNQNPEDSEVHGWLNDLLKPSSHTQSTLNKSKKKSRLGSNVIIGNINEESDTEETKNPIVCLKEVTEFDKEMFNSLSLFENPSYDVHEIQNKSNGKGLYYFSWHLFKTLNLFQKFRICETKFLSFITKIQDGYINTNPYHNSIHAADVTHSMYYYISRKKIWQHLTAEEQLASLIAPIIHDFAHPGVNNPFLVGSLDPLAIRYSDLSVLEHFHSATAFGIMQHPESNFLENLSNDERKSVRELTIGMVLATDMTFHFDWIGKFKTKMGGNGLNLEQKLDRKLYLNMAIKCADVNNPSKPLCQSQKWTELVMEEFFRQGDREKSMGMPVSMFMARGQTDIPKCQVGFIDYLVLPLFDAWNLFMEDDIKPHLENIHGNRAYWKKLCDEAIAINPVALEIANSKGSVLANSEVHNTNISTSSPVSVFPHHENIALAKNLSKDCMMTKSRELLALQMKKSASGSSTNSGKLHR